MEKPDPELLVTHQELLMSQVLQLDAVTRLLINKGLFTEAELYQELKLVQAEYMKKKGSGAEAKLSRKSSQEDRQVPIKLPLMLQSRWESPMEGG